MDKKMTGFVVVFVITTVAFGILVQQAVNKAESRPVPPQVSAGKDAFQSKACIECHTVFGNGGYSGGDLTKVYSKYGKDLPDFLASSRPMGSFAKRKQHLRLNQQQAQEVAAYLKFIDSTENLDWPPRTILN